MLKHSFCSDPRDKVYALSALEPLSESAKAELGIAPLRVDYTLTLPDLVLSILEDRFVSLPPESNPRRRYREFFLCLGFKYGAADKVMEWTTEDAWPKEPPSFIQLLDTLNFEYEHCRTVARLALDRSRTTVQPYARRWEQISDAIFGQFERLTREREHWSIAKGRWDVGEFLGVAKYPISPSHGEDRYWYLVGKHLARQ